MRNSKKIEKMSYGLLKSFFLQKTKTIRSLLGTTFLNQLTHNSYLIQMKDYLIMKTSIWNTTRLLIHVYSLLEDKISQPMKMRVTRKLEMFSLKELIPSLFIFLSIKISIKINTLTLEQNKSCN